MGIIRGMRKTAKPILKKYKKGLVLVVVVLVAVLAAGIIWSLHRPAGPTVTTPKQPEYTYKTADGYSYAVSFSNVVFDRANAKPGQINVSAEFTFRNVTEGHTAPLPNSNNAQIIAFDTLAHPECAYAKFRTNPGACDLEGATLKTRGLMYYGCSSITAAGGFGSIKPGESVTCTQDLSPVSETRYAQLGEKALKNTFVGYLGVKNGQVDRARCLYSIYGNSEIDQYADTSMCEPGYVTPPGDPKLSDEAYASDWHALGSRW